MTLHRLGLISTRLQAFQAVVRFGSVRRAAEALGVAPSAVSRTLRQLEEGIGTPLFERARQRLKLTSAGEILVYHAGASQAELQRACAFIDDLAGLRRGSVTVAAVESVARGLLPEVLSRFWARCPDVEVRLHVTGSGRAFEAVARGECDLAIGFDAKPPKGTVRLAGAGLKLGALMRPDHRLARRPRVRLADFSADRVILADASLTLGASLEAAMPGDASALRSSAVTNSIHLMSDLAVRGHGVTFQTRVGVERELAEGALVFVPLADPGLKPRKLMLVTRAKAHLPAGPAVLATLLTEAVQALDGQ
ncbi:LysR family transcriptional regulator [Rhodoplanes roseus]|uniref:LysR family transcriptional regulator n=1 Tax=Rhodoplanes roseus TaxID=29409 RepID=A0A327KCQ1_9BRAD|nr:LysR substrate-binding domain-containing protein [Rhodoplanes roseus]RAI36117.1 LysR family transcriptional regulator [Rhodoplanes roseus]